MWSPDYRRAVCAHVDDDQISILVRQFETLGFVQNMNRAASERVEAANELFCGTKVGAQDDD